MANDDKESATRREWFSASDSSSAAGAEFVESLRAAAAQWSFIDLPPDATRLDGLTAQITVPGLTCNTKFLRVDYDPSADAGATLRGEWTDECEFDDCSAMDFDLVVNGVDALPAQYGQWAADWLRRQLSRAVVRQEWDEQPHPFAPAPGGSRRVSSRRWAFADSDETLDENGSWFGRWLFKRPPDRVQTEWTGAQNP